MVYLTPLFSDSSNFNLELKACAIYQCGRTRGVEFLEPVVSVVKPDGTDTRLDDFFLKGRPVAAASGAAPEPAAAAAQQAPKGEP